MLYLFFYPPYHEHCNNAGEEASQQTSITRAARSTSTRSTLAWAETMFPCICHLWNGILVRVYKWQPLSNNLQCYVMIDELKLLQFPVEVTFLILWLYNTYLCVSILPEFYSRGRFHWDSHDWWHGRAWVSWASDLPRSYPSPNRSGEQCNYYPPLYLVFLLKLTSANRCLCFLLAVLEATPRTSEGEVSCRATSLGFQLQDTVLLFPTVLFFY